MSLISTYRKSDRHFIDLNTHTKMFVFPLIFGSSEKKKSCTKDKESFIPTENIFFLSRYRPREKTYQKTFYYMSFASTKSWNGVKRKQNRTLVSSNNCFKLQNLLESQASRYCRISTLSLARSLLKGKQALLLGLIGYRLMLSNNIPVP